MTIALGCDHGGLDLKNIIIKHLKSKGYKIKDFGTYDDNSCDYSDFAVPVCESVVSKESDFGVLICFNTSIAMTSPFVLLLCAKEPVSGIAQPGYDISVIV